jgi:hypothetical protein
VTTWQITAKAIYCDAVEDDVIIQVKPDGSTECTGYQKYVEAANPQSMAILKKRSQQLGRQVKCEGPLDIRVTSYRDLLMAQEKAGG